MRGAVETRVDTQSLTRDGQRDAFVACEGGNGPRDGLAVGKFEKTKRQSVGEIIVGAVLACAERKKRAGTNVERKTQVIISRTVPASADFHFAGKRVRPASFRQIVIDRAIFGENGRDQQGIAHHELTTNGVPSP